MQHICPFCCLTFQTEPQTPSTGTQTGAASMPSVTSLTVIWRGERKSGRSIHTSCLAFLFFFDRLWFAVLWKLTVLFFYTKSRPQLATRLLAHKIQSPQEWEAMQALLVSLNLSQQMFYLRLLQQRLSLGGGESVLDHSTDSVVLLRRNGRTDEGLNCKDVSPSSLCVTHRGSTTVSNVELSLLVPHRSSLHASDA